MDSSGRPDVSELLAHGYFKTARGRSPSCSTPPPTIEYTTTPAFPRTRDDHNYPRGRSRSRNTYQRPPPPPTVEDEAVSLARESDSASAIPCDDPPLRGVLEQYPIILEAGITEAEASAMHILAARDVRDEDNPDRRFVLMPKSDTYSPNRKDEGHPKDWNNLKAPPPEGVRKRRSRQDLPALQTKLPSEIPAQLRRTPSNSKPAERDMAPRRLHPRAQSELLSPASSRYPAAVSPRHHSESLGNRVPSPSSARHNGRPPSRSSTPLSKHHSLDMGKPRPSQLVDDESQRGGRHASPNPKNLSVDVDPRRTGRSRSRRRHYSSDSDDGDSDSRRYHHRHHRSREIYEEEARQRRKFSSPLPSPTASPNYLARPDRERAETYPQRSGSRSPIDRAVSPFSPAIDTPRSSKDRIDTPRSSKDRLNPMGLDSPITRPRSRQSNPIPVPMAYPPPPPSPQPSPSNMAKSDHKPSLSRDPPPQQTPYWQPPLLQPSSAEKPVISYRRYSEDADSGAIAPLPTCPRVDYSRGHADWLTLPQCPSFDICPSCFESAIEPTALRRFFVKSPRSPETEILCDFGSSPWYRIAWLIIRKERLPDMKLFYGLANIAATTPQCLGKHEGVRQWYYLIDPKTRAPVHNFYVCAGCVKSVEVILPSIHGIFMRDPNRPMGPSRVCDFRFDSKRFIKYFDILETTADRADENDAPPDPRALVSLAKRMAQFPECQREKDLTDRSWNVITQLPEFTVCEECFDEIVWPELEDEKAIPMMFNKALQRLPKASCQLYSPKMRGIFRTAVDVDDYKLLASKARERKLVETTYKSNLEGLKRQLSMGKVNPKFVAMETRRVEEEWAKWA